ncbi:metallophosphoesterase [bacterium]|nr:metallophosphoesterase [bacterium]
MRVRRWVYAMVWGSTLLAFLSKLTVLPSTLRFAMWAVAVVVNFPGVVLVGQTLGYLFVRTPIGHLAAALLTCLLLEPMLRWIEWPLRRPGQDPQEGTRGVTRRALLLSGVGLGGSGLVAGYSYWVERKNYQLHAYRLYLADLPQGLEGLRLVLMADLHCGPVNRPGDLLPAIRMANRCKPDLILLPGDFVHVSKSYFSQAAELIDQLHCAIPDGILLGWGNHDHWNDVEAARQTLSQTQGQILVQQRRLLQADRTFSSSGKGLWLAGVDDLWEGKPDVAQVLRGLPRDQPRLVLAHNPDTAEEQKCSRVDLMVSGHTHGGQIQVPVLGTPMLPSRYGQKYASGFVQGPSYPVYVTRGLGVGGLPVRLGVPPEVTLFELHRSPDRTRIEPMSS